MPIRRSAAVDTRHKPSLSFARLDPAIEHEQPVSPPNLTPPDRASDARSRRPRPRIVVETGRKDIVAATLASPGGHLGMSEYPVQVSKVQAPPLREETLARDRLLEWLSVKVHRRAVLLIAEAGYGKTTLLADFTRRTRLRILWFRLDRGDRDWVGFLAYLVAAVRIHVPEFGTATTALLRETATTAPPLDTVLDAFLRELGGLPNEPTAIVFDDFHLVDDAPDVRTILRELLTRGPERMSFVFASRRQPPVRLARLRALGEVAELRTDDLRFDAAETERLFRDTYEMRLEPAVLAELSRRTEGWAASLQLVRAALHDRNPAQVRSFISSLSGAEGHLYEYLAEEVVGELPIDLQEFLMRTSVLDTVDLALAPVAGDVSIPETRDFIDAGERHGLFGKGGPNTRHVARAHPLVRDFLLARLSRSIGYDGVREIHLRVARAAEALDWRIAGRHFLASGHEDEARRVLGAAIETILATGAYAAAD
ncbi:MAG: AAA family ATPase, partial [Candidatus Limnocylindrales bacterium]